MGGEGRGGGERGGGGEGRGGEGMGWEGVGGWEGMTESGKELEGETVHFLGDLSKILKAIYIVCNFLWSSYILFILSSFF